MKIKLLVTVLVLLVLAVVMLAPAMAQNDVVVDETTNEYNEHYWNEVVNAYGWQMVFPNPPYLTFDFEGYAEGGSRELTGTIYHNEFTADYGGGTGYAIVTVDADSWSQSNTTETTEIYNNPAPGVMEYSNTEVTTHDDWFGAFESNRTTTWTP